MSGKASERVRVSDRLWARAGPLIVQADPEAGADGRFYLEALLYQAITGEHWEVLVTHGAQWSAAYAARVRWQQRGLLDQLSQLLLVRLA